MGFDQYYMKNTFLRTLSTVAQPRNEIFQTKVKKFYKSSYEWSLSNLMPWKLNVLLDDEEEGEL